MNSPKIFVPATALLLLACLLVSGCWFNRNSDRSSTQIVQVTAIPSAVQATMTLVSPTVVRATPDAEVLSATNLPLATQDAADANQAGANQADADQADADQADYTSNIPTAPHGIPTPLPASEDTVRGESLKQMRETDRDWEVAAPDPTTLSERVQAELAEDVVLLYLDDFFSAAFDPWTGTPPTITDKLLSLDGRQVEMRGYMAPPLKLGLDWFLLGELPVGVCPFHPTVGSITSGSALVYIEGPEYPFSSEPLSVVGEMHIGELTDPETGMVSIARLYTTKDEINVLTLARP